MEKSFKISFEENFEELANALQIRGFHEKIKIGVTLLGSDYGLETILEGTKLAFREGDVEIVLIGPHIGNCPFEVAPADSEEEAHRIMETLLETNYIQAAVTLHYNFPLGVTTVGRVISPATGKEIFIATTSGTSDCNRNQTMLKNVIYGICTAKSCGVETPVVGILNVDGSVEVENALEKLRGNGYTAFTIGDSRRTDMGHILQGNDLILGSADVVVTDSLTGNILMKMFSSFNSGGNYETVGYGYGPGMSFNYSKPIFLVSRSSSPRVIAGAIKYATQAITGKLYQILQEEYTKVLTCNFNRILLSLK